MKVLFFCQDGAKVEQLVLALRLRWPDLKAHMVARAELGLDALENDSPELVILCEDLPDLSLWDSIREIRRFSEIPLIVAANGTTSSEVDVVKAIELGADDFLMLPCNLMVVMAKVVALMRRVGLSKQELSDGPIHCGDLLINSDTYEAYLGNIRLQLTPTEFKLLHLLARNRNMTLSQDFIQRVLWVGEVNASDTLKKYVQRLRRKLGEDARNPIWIKTVHGVGYRFSTPVPSQPQGSPLVPALSR